MYTTSCLRPTHTHPHTHTHTQTHRHTDTYCSCESFQSLHLEILTTHVPHCLSIFLCFPFVCLFLSVLAPLATGRDGFGPFHCVQQEQHICTTALRLQLTHSDRE